MSTDFPNAQPMPFPIPGPGPWEQVLRAGAEVGTSLYGLNLTRTVVGAYNLEFSRRLQLVSLYDVVGKEATAITGDALRDFHLAHFRVFNRGKIFI